MKQLWKKDEEFYTEAYIYRAKSQNQSIIDLWGYEGYNETCYVNYHYKSSFENYIIKDKISNRGRFNYISKVVKLQCALRSYTNIEYHEQLSKEPRGKILEDRNQIKVEEALSYLMKTIQISKKYKNVDVHGIILEDRRKITHPYMIEQLVVREAIKIESPNCNYDKGTEDYEYYMKHNDLDKIDCKEAIELSNSGANIVLDVLRTLVKGIVEQRHTPTIEGEVIKLTNEDIEDMNKYLTDNYKDKYYVGPDYYWPNEEISELDFNSINHWGKKGSQWNYISSLFEEIKIGKITRTGNKFKRGAITFSTKVMSKVDNVKIIPIEKWRLTLQSNRNLEIVQAILKYLISTQLKSCQLKKCKKYSDYMGRYQSAYKKGYSNVSTIAKVLRWMHTNEKLRRYAKSLSKVKEEEGKREIGHIIKVSWSYAIIKLDISKAFDNVRWKSIKEIIMKDVIENNKWTEWVLTWSMIRDMYIGFWGIYTGKINPNNQSESYDESLDDERKPNPNYEDERNQETVFLTRRGVGQGTKLGPTIFNIVINHLINEQEELNRMQERGFIEIYGDDIYVQVLPKAKEIDHMIDIIADWIGKAGLKLNKDKTWVIYHEKIEGLDYYPVASKLNPVRVLGFNVGATIKETVEIVEEEIAVKLRTYKHVLNEDSSELSYKLAVFKEASRLIGEKLRPLARARVINEENTKGFIHRSLNIILGLKDEKWVARIFGLLPMAVQRQLVKGLRNMNKNLLDEHMKYKTMDFIPGHTRSHLGGGSWMVPTLTFYWYKVDPLIIFDTIAGIEHWTDILALVSEDWSRGRKLRWISHEYLTSINKALRWKNWDLKEDGKEERYVRFDSNHILEWDGTEEIREVLPYTIEHMKMFARWTEDSKLDDILSSMRGRYEEVIKGLVKDIEENENKYYDIVELTRDHKIVINGENHEFEIVDETIARRFLYERVKDEIVKIRSKSRNDDYKGRKTVKVFLECIKLRLSLSNRNDPETTGRTGALTTITWYDEIPTENNPNINKVIMGELTARKRVPYQAKEGIKEIKVSKMKIQNMYTELIGKSVILREGKYTQLYDNVYDRQIPLSWNRRMNFEQLNFETDVEHKYYDYDEMHKAVWMNRANKKKRVCMKLQRKINSENGAITKALIMERKKMNRTLENYTIY
jgi:hypothetical protein